MFNLLLRCLDFQHRKAKTPQNRFSRRLVLRRFEYLRNQDLRHSVGCCDCHECVWNGRNPYRYRFGCDCQPCQDIALLLWLPGNRGRGDS